MKKLQQTLQQIEERESPGLMMHIVAGYPNLNDSLSIAQTILEAGADILEVQIPFSDPVADGPVIASANEAALRQGTSVAASLDMIGKLAANTDAPILIMTYFNIVHAYGVKTFTQKAKALGVEGLIIPDYPLDEEEGNGLLKACAKAGLAMVQVLASTTREDRMKQILDQASGMVYCMARTGTTGKRTVITEETQAYLQRVRYLGDLPIAVGFGLSERSQMEALQNHADIMVVGSALIKAYADKPLEESLEAIQTFMGALRD